MAISDRVILELFVDAADELVNSSFAKEIQRGISTKIAIKEGKLVSLDKQGPTREALKACLLTVRMYTQNNDPLSFHNMADLVAGLNVPQPLKVKFALSRTSFNAYLDRPPIVPVQGANADTNRIIFLTFLYGMFAHRDRAHVETLQQWSQAPFYPDLHAQFDVIVYQFMIAAAGMANTVKEMLKEAI